MRPGEPVQVRGELGRIEKSEDSTVPEMLRTAIFGDPDSSSSCEYRVLVGRPHIGTRQEWASRGMLEAQSVNVARNNRLCPSKRVRVQCLRFATYEDWPYC